MSRDYEQYPDDDNGNVLWQMLEDEDTNEWVITIYVYMEPEYADIVDLEEWFSKIAVQFEGEYDGWGCMAYIYDDEDFDPEEELNSQ